MTARSAPPTQPPAIARVLPRTAAALLAALTLCTAPAPAAQGSGLGALLDPAKRSNEVDRETVLDAARGSFADAVDRRLALRETDPITQLRGVESIPEDRREELARSTRDEFDDAIEREVTELLGDGVLLAEEVSQALTEAREWALALLEDDVQAAASGHTRPPRRRQHATDRSFRVALARYTFLERNSWVDWLILFGAGLGGFVLGVGVLKGSRWKLGDRGGGRGVRLLRAALERLDGPLYLLSASGGLVLGLSAVWLPSAIDEPIRTTLMLIVILASFWASWRLVATATRRLGDWATPSGDTPGEQALEVSRKVFRIGLILLFAFIVVEVLFGTEFTTVIAGLGIVGVAVTLAAQDTLKDLFAAITIHSNQPFSLGDLVRFQGYFGNIEEISFRTTRIRTLDGHLVTIPNSKIISEPLENVGARPHVRRRFHIDLPFHTSVEKIARAVELVREVVVAAGDLDENQDVQVHFDEIGAHSLRLLVQYYYGKGDYWAAKRKATEVDLALVERFGEEGIEFAFPTQTLHVVDADGPEEPGELDADPGGDTDASGKSDEDASDGDASDGGPAEEQPTERGEPSSTGAARNGD